MRYKYKVLDHCVDSVYDINCNLGEEDADWIAAEAAENYHNKHDGWESSWPLRFEILTEDGTRIDTFTVDRESAPVFYAYKLKETK